MVYTISKSIGIDICACISVYTPICIYPCVRVCVFYCHLQKLIEGQAPRLYNLPSKTYICIYTYMHIYMCIYICIYIDVSYVRMCVSAIYVYAWTIYVCIYVCIQNMYLDIFMHVCICI